MVRPCSTTEVLSQCHWFAKLNFTFDTCKKQFANCLSSQSGKISSPIQNLPNCSPSGLHPPRRHYYMRDIKSFHQIYFMTISKLRERINVIVIKKVGQTIIIMIKTFIDEKLLILSKFSRSSRIWSYWYTINASIGIYIS